VAQTPNLERYHLPVVHKNRNRNLVCLRNLSVCCWQQQIMLLVCFGGWILVKN